MAILVVEDSADDALLILRALEKAGARSAIRVVRDGEAAVSYFAGAGKYADRGKYPMPGLVLLDLNLPKIDGFEVLKWIRNEREMSELKVVVLTTSQNMKAVGRAYAAGANAFLVKPVEFANYLGLGHGIKDFWLSVADAAEVA
jgi:CheY-like chemotaxis protein